MVADYHVVESLECLHPYATEDRRVTSAIVFMLSITIDHKSHGIISSLSLTSNYADFRFRQAIAAYNYKAKKCNYN